MVGIGSRRVSVHWGSLGMWGRKGSHHDWDGGLAWMGVSSGRHWAIWSRWDGVGTEGDRDV